MTGLIVTLYIVVILAAIAATMFPIMYSFAPWHVDPLGRALMFKAISFALAIDLTVLLQVWQPDDIRVAIWVSIFVFGCIAVATGWLTYMLWQNNFTSTRRRKNGRTPQPRTPFQ